MTCVVLLLICFYTTAAWIENKTQIKRNQFYSESDLSEPGINENHRKEKKSSQSKQMNKKRKKIQITDARVTKPLRF